MNRPVKELRGIPVLAQDGAVGWLRDLYFDDRKWVVRDLALASGHWLTGRVVLIPIASVRARDPGATEIALELTRSQVAARAGIGQFDARSGASLHGYRIEAADGTMGRVEDLLIDDADWSIAGVVVDTRELLPGGNVVIAPSAVVAIDSANRALRVSLTRDQIRRAPQAG